MTFTSFSELSLLSSIVQNLISWSKEISIAQFVDNNSSEKFFSLCKFNSKTKYLAYCLWWLNGWRLSQVSPWVGLHIAPKNVQKDKQSCLIFSGFFTLRYMRAWKNRDSNANLVLICESLKIYARFVHDLWFWDILEQNRWQSSN